MPLSTRAFTGTFANVTSGVLVAILDDPAGASAAGMAVPGPMEFPIAAGATSGTLHVPGNYRFLIRVGGVDRYRFPAGDNWIGVDEGAATTLQELFLASAESIDLTPQHVVVGAALTQLKATGITNGYRPAALNGDVVWTEDAAVAAGAGTLDHAQLYLFLEAFGS